MKKRKSLQKRLNRFSLIKQRAGSAFLFLLIMMILLPPLQGRDIDLDAIYISKKYPRFSALARHRFEAWRLTGAFPVDRNVTGLHWTGGRELLYLRELSQLTIIYRFDLRRHHKKELFRYGGVITASSPARGGRYMMTKGLRVTRRSLPLSERCLVDLKKGDSRCRAADYPFRDFTLYHKKTAFVTERPRGFIAFFPDTGTRRLIISRRRYSSYLSKENLRLLRQSPGGLYSMIIAGSGGAYRGLLLSGGKSRLIKNLTSSSEFHWLSEQRAVYRTGTTGNYYVTIHDFKNKMKNTISRRTLHSGISAPSVQGSIAFLENQVIQFHDVNTSRTCSTGLEGDDVAFSPDGTLFACLIYGRCMVARRERVLAIRNRLRPKIRSLLSFYRDIKKQKKYHMNDFSQKYCDMKIKTYKNFLER